MLKKTILLALFCVAVHTAEAQLGFHAGANGSFIKRVDNIFFLDMGYQWTPGFQFGVSYDIGRVFVFQPALFFQQKGHRVSISVTPDNEPAQTLISRQDLYYLEMPLNIMLKFKLKDEKLKIFFGTGISGSVGLFSGLYTKRSTDRKWEKSEYSGFGKKQGGMNRWDVGVQGFVGLQLYQFTLTVNYNHSFIDQIPVGGLEQRNRVLSVNVGYRIGKDKQTKKNSACKSI